MEAFLVFCVLLIIALSTGIGILVWYIKKLLKEVAFSADGILFIKEEVEDFERHLSMIHKMSVSYHDDHIINLLKHSKELVQSIRLFRRIYKIVDDKNDEEYELKSLEEEEKEEVAILGIGNGKIRTETSSDEELFAELDEQGNETESKK